MDQQNQQPIQGKTENKPSIKTNWKYVAIVAVLGLVVGGTIILLLQSFPGDVQQPSNLPFQQNILKKVPPFNPETINCEETPQFCMTFGDLPSDPVPAEGEWYYVHALQFALEENNPKYCDLVIERFMSDYGISEERSEDECRVDFAIQSKNAEYLTHMQIGVRQ